MIKCQSREIVYVGIKFNRIIKKLSLPKVCSRALINHYYNTSYDGFKRKLHHLVVHTSERIDTKNKYHHNIFK